MMLRKPKPVAIFLLTLIILLIGWFIYAFEWTGWDFRNNLWAPAHLLMHGESPYNIKPLLDNCRCLALWFPQIITVFSPLGLLPLQQASNLWIIINASTVVVLTSFIMRQFKRENLNLLIYGLVLIAVFLFPPSVSHFRLGQADFVLIAAMIISAYMLAKEKVPLTAFGFALVLAKPQIGFLTIPGALLSLIFKKKGQYSLRLALSTGLLVIALTIPFWLADIHWLNDLIGSLQENRDWLQPALIVQLQVKLGHQGFLLWLVIAISCLALSTVLWIKLHPSQAVLWSMALTTLAAPYIWSWDFTLLLPLFIDTAVRLTKASSRLVLLTTWLLVFYFSIVSLKFNPGDDRLWWLPFIMLLGIIVSLALEYKVPSSSARPTLINT